MDPKISKKTQDTLGKIIKKPPLTEKLLSKPPFRFLHDIMTSVIKTTGMMKGLFSDSEMNSENVKDKDSKIAFLQKAIDFTVAASGKQLSIKPAKVVAGHEPEKTNEFLQALASAINANVNNDDIIAKVTGKSSGSSSKKEERKEDRREKSADRRKRDEEKKSRDKSTDKERSRDREDRHKDREDRHKDREDKQRDERHKDRDKEKEDRHKDKERERESRHKSGRSRIEDTQGKNIDPDPLNQITDENELDLELDDMDVTEIKSDENCSTPFPTPDVSNVGLNSTYAVIKPIPRQVSTYCEMRRDGYPTGDDVVEPGEPRQRSKRPKAARPRRSIKKDIEDQLDNTGSNDSDMELGNDSSRRKHGAKSRLQDRPHENIQDSPIHDKDKRSIKDKRDPRHKGPKTSTPKNSPDPPTRLVTDVKKKKEEKNTKKAAKYGDISPKKLGRSPQSSPFSPGRSPLALSDSARRRSVGLNAATKQRLKKTSSKQGFDLDLNADNVDSELIFNDQNDDRTRMHKKKHRSRNNISESGGDSDKERTTLRKKDKVLYKNDDYAHNKLKKKKKRSEDLSTEQDDSSDLRDSDEQYYKKKRPHGERDKRKRSSFASLLFESQQRREEEGKENDAPPQEMVNGDHNPPTAAPAKMQRPSSAKGSRRRMEDVPAQRKEPTLGQDDLPPQVQGRLARPSSARPAPPKRKEDMAQSEPTMRLGSGKPQNLIIDDGKDDDEDETFVVEESAPPPVEPTQTTMVNNEEEDDEDHGGLVKKIMETKKEYEQPRDTKVERPTISDAQRRKQREAVQREIDKLRGSIQTLTRSANPLGKIMDYVQEDLDSMQKELEKWKAENKEHALALKREKAITDRAIEPLKVQLTEVDQQIKDQLDLIGAVKCNIIRNDQKIEKMLRTIAKS